MVPRKPVTLRRNSSLVRPDSELDLGFGNSDFGFGVFGFGMVA